MAGNGKATRNEIRVKRVYEKAGPEDGLRLLVDDLWPWRITPDMAKVAAWRKDLAPSAALREWYGKDRLKWDEFVQRYYAELDANPFAWQQVLVALQRGPVTLVHGAPQVLRNGAVALQAYLEARVRGKKPDWKAVSWASTERPRRPSRPRASRAR